MSNRFKFQGKDKQKNYFEGWYVKCTDVENDLSVALIPGVSHFSDKQSFVQYNIHHKGQSYSGMLTFGREDFEVVSEPYSIRMPKFVLSEKGVKASLKDEDNQIVLDFSFGNFLSIKQTMYMPSIMGPFEYLVMPCAHDIVSMKHEVKGTLILNGEKIKLSSAVGYIEKDRGHTFPSKYIWLQSNSFVENPKVSLSLAVATIEKSILKFTGLIAVFHDGIKEHRYATYLGSKLEVEIDEGAKGFSVRLKNKSSSLEVKVRITNERELISPMDLAMDFPIKETVKSKVALRFKEKGKKAMTLTSENAAAECLN